MENTVGVACLDADGNPWRLGKPFRHHHVLRYRNDEGIPIRHGYTSQGFWTNTRRYVSRREGWRIAEAAGHLTTAIHEKYTGIPEHPCPGTLYSEDLW